MWLQTIVTIGVLIAICFIGYSHLKKQGIGFNAREIFGLTPEEYRQTVLGAKKTGVKRMFKVKIDKNQNLADLENFVSDKGMNVVFEKGEAYLVSE